MTQIQTAETIAAQGNQPPAGGWDGKYAPVVPAYSAPVAPAAIPAPIQAPVTSPQSEHLKVGTQDVQVGGSESLLTEIAAGLRVLTDERAARMKSDAQQCVFDAVVGKSGGTQADFDAFNAWAAKSMDKAQIVALNTTLTNGEPAVQSAMVAGYAAQFRADTQHHLVVGNTNIVPMDDNSQGYIDATSFAEVMKSEKYKTNSVYAKAQDDLRSRSIKVEAV